MKKTNHFITGSYCIRRLSCLGILCNQSGIEIHLALLQPGFLQWLLERNGFSYQEMEHAVTKGIYDGMSAILILLAVGAGRNVDFRRNCTQSDLLRSKSNTSVYLLLATLILCSITSIATGTSWGTVGTSGIAMMGIGSALGIPAPITAGAVLSGAYFGDKLSPLSDSCVLSAAMADIDVIDHVRGILPVSLSAFGITGIAFTVLGFRLGGGSGYDTGQQRYGGTSGKFSYQFIRICANAGCYYFTDTQNAVPAGYFICGTWNCMGHYISGTDSVKAISTAWVQLEMNTGIEFIDSLLSRGGMNSMLWSVAIIILGLGFGGLLDRIGIIKAIAGKVYQHINNGGTLTVFTIIVGFLGCLLGSAMYVSLVLTENHGGKV